MISVKSSLKLLGVSIAAIALAGGCATAKKGEMADAAEAPAAAAAAETMMMKDDSYTVVQNDCLWCISKQEGIYNDPFSWPIIYSRNRSQIKDADLIYPGQVLTIARTFQPGEVAKAITHAKNRGPWAIGTTEESDVAFLAANPI